MKVLALDTTTRAGSIAIVDDDTVVDERSGDAARTHAERMPAEILALADANRTPLASVDLFAVASGPGSFTGLRIGIATLQGFALVQGRKMIGIPALEALAHCASRDLPAGACVAAWMDAYRRDVFAALYRVMDAPVFDPDRLVEIEAARVDSPASTWARWSGLGLPAVVIGEGAVLYRETIASARVLPPPLLAGAIGRLAVGYARRGGAALHPSGIHPLYVRRPDAEMTRDKNIQHEGH